MKFGILSSEPAAAYLLTTTLMAFVLSAISPTRSTTNKLDAATALTATTKCQVKAARDSADPSAIKMKTG